MKRRDKTPNQLLKQAMRIVNSPNISRERKVKVGTIYARLRQIASAPTMTEKRLKAYGYGIGDRYATKDFQVERGKSSNDILKQGERLYLRAQGNPQRQELIKDITRRYVTNALDYLYKQRATDRRRAPRFYNQKGAMNIRVTSHTYKGLNRG